MALCTSSKATDQVLEAMRWYFGARHCRTITFVDDVGGALDGEYFDLNIIDENYAEKKYVVLLSDGTTTTVAGLPATTTLITVTFTANDDAATIIALFETQLDAIGVRYETTGDDIEVQNALVGLITAEVNTNAASLTFAIGKAGFGGYLGQTGESELSTTTEVVPLTDDANGTVPLDEIIVGYLMEITIPLREMTTERWESIIGAVTGNTVTIDSNDITGWGTKKLYESLFSYSGRLVGHPVRLVNTDYSEDICMLSTAPKVNSINYSGASVQEAEVMFSSYKDANAPEEINLLARGDHRLF